MNAKKYIALASIISLSACFAIYKLVMEHDEQAQSTIALRGEQGKSAKQPNVGQFLARLQPASQGGSKDDLQADPDSPTQSVSEYASAIEEAKQEAEALGARLTTLHHDYLNLRQKGEMAKAERFFKKELGPLIARRNELANEIINNSTQRYELAMQEMRRKIRAKL